MDFTHLPGSCCIAPNAVIAIAGIHGIVACRNKNVKG